MVKERTVKQSLNCGFVKPFYIICTLLLFVFAFIVQATAQPEEEQSPASSNKTPEFAPATASGEGIVTAHEQEKDAETEFHSRVKGTIPKDKKRYVGSGVEYEPGKGARFFGLVQLSRFPFLTDSINSLSAKGGGQGTTGPIGSMNYFSDYLFFNTLHRRVSLQLTISSDLDPNRNLGGPPVDERQSLGFGRVEVEPFRDRTGSLVRFYAEGRYETVSFHSMSRDVAKMNLTTLDLGAFYLFESSEVENPRRIRVQPLSRNCVLKGVFSALTLRSLRLRGKDPGTYQRRDAEHAEERRESAVPRC